ncbi:hypothetical protein [Burkholderia cenocepacia]|uniref:hypothetical protein n=1 Tax=Burkholderia cenocepacia TaxID=95486 RepID=UPI0013E04BA5|nr:hypothetical protein [Burkholderia cenocepacia]MCW3587418.1 hypothetical protein [Burkholderia cenocepacia]MCW3633886.1 hypothetical protein [Burkholderia cenocepacia]MCW5184788.1 hypothetical protein [Burkholderia cenocepacia]NGO98018.1 hypothetical protein [Burkholderia cenocepacia]
MTDKFRKYSFDKVRRKDGEEFALSAILYELPSSYDYWLVSYQAEHKEWNYQRFTLTIPKALAMSVELAEAIVRGAGILQVESILQHATKGGRPIAPVFSDDGWILI